MKRHILNAMAGGALLLGSLYGQSTSTPAPGSDAAEGSHHAEREAKQKARIQQGVNSGELTQKQGTRLERQDQRINKEANRMAARNGGQLNERQERRIHRQMNRQSRKIYRAKH
ncbi:MAG: hypothetical protein U0Q18_01030 [Bryobacteraceae bacterium]